MAQNTRVVASMKYPTPQWFRVFIRTCLWITGLYALVSIQINFTDFGVSIATENLILKYMAVFSTLVSVIGRFIGEKPIDFSRFEANEEQHMTVYAPLEEKSDYLNKIGSTIINSTAILYVANNSGTAWFDNDAPNLHPDLVVEGTWDSPPVIFINGAGVQSVELLGGAHPPQRPR